MDKKHVLSLFAKGKINKAIEMVLSNGSIDKTSKYRIVIQGAKHSIAKKTIEISELNIKIL